MKVLLKYYVENSILIYKGVDGKKEEGVKRQMIWMEGIIGMDLAWNN